MPQLARIVAAGSVDAGKSTLIGRILLETGAVADDQLAEARAATERRGDGDVDLSLLVDGLRAERDGRMTIDVGHRYFSAGSRQFVLADAPGHLRYTANMFTGASTADIALFVLDASTGLDEQARRHLFIGRMLAIPHIVVCVNKMDSVAWSESAFALLVTEIEAITEIAAAVPVSALYGDNIGAASPRLTWHSGPPLLGLLQSLPVDHGSDAVGARLPVQWVIRHGAERLPAGQIACGTLRPGQDVVVLPSGRRTRLTSIETLAGPLEAAGPLCSVSVRLADAVDVSRGDLLCHPGEEPVPAREIDAMLCWMGQTPLRPGATSVMKHTTRKASVRVDRLIDRIDLHTLQPEFAPESLSSNDIGRIRLSTSAPLLVDPYAASRRTGAFILIDEESTATVAAGIVLRAAAGPTDLTPTSDHVTWQPSRIDRGGRRNATGLRGATLWLTGLPAAGKSTIAQVVERRLLESGVPAYTLDGDNLRHGLSGDLGFSPSDRAENGRRVAHVARILADAGVIALVSLVSPYATDRAKARELHRLVGLPFIEIWVDTPIEVCMRRDTKGLYARARRGEIVGVTGVDAPYEPPAAPELVLRQRSISSAATAVLATLRLCGVLH